MPAPTFVLLKLSTAKAGKYLLLSFHHLVSGEAEITFRQEYPYEPVIILISSH
jgi:hypothetical protein